MNKRFVNKIIFPLSDLLTGWDVAKSLGRLKKSFLWPEQAIYEYQCRKLQYLIRHSYDCVPYYRQLLDSHGIKPAAIQTPEDLKLLPILTKEIIRENYDKKTLLSSKADVRDLISVHSSGSTGVRTPLLITKEAYGHNLACNIRGWEQMGYTIGDRLIKISQNRRTNRLKQLQDAMNNTKLFALPYTNDGLSAFGEMFRSFRPEFIRSYPEPLLFIVDAAIKNGIRMRGVKAINSTGNILFGEIRSAVEDYFECKIFDSYSCEGGATVFECAAHDHYHVSEEYGIVELIGPDGREAAENETGRIVVTDLQNTAFPFIRYDSKDFGVKAGSCHLGIAHKTIKKIIGRDNDILVSPLGQYLVAQTFTTYFKYLPEINQFQVYQPELNRLVFRLVPNIEIAEQILEKIRKYWTEYTDNSMEIEFELVEKIDPLSSGKARFLIRNPLISIKDIGR